MGKLFLRTFGNYDGDKASDEAGFACTPGDGMTQQQFGEECDINTIVKRFGLTGELPENYRAPVSGDFSDVVDFHTAMQAVRKAEESFMALPAPLRAEFGNDPQRLVEFVSDEANRGRAVELGLVPKPAEVDRAGVVVEPVKPA